MSENLNENQQKLLKRNREWFFRLTAFLVGFTAGTMISLITISLYDPMIDDEVRRRLSPPVRVVDVLPDEANEDKRTRDEALEDLP